MPRKDLVSLSIEAVDELERIRNLQKLVNVSLEQLNQPKDDTIDTLFLLLDSYRASMDQHIQELEVVLTRLQLLVCGTEQDYGN